VILGKTIALFVHYLLAYDHNRVVTYLQVNYVNISGGIVCPRTSQPEYREDSESCYHGDNKCCHYILPVPRDPQGRSAFLARISRLCVATGIHNAITAPIR
jgi:hypothetical protein